MDPQPIPLTFPWLCEPRARLSVPNLQTKRSSFGMLKKLPSLPRFNRSPSPQPTVDFDTWKASSDISKTIEEQSSVQSLLHRINKVLATSEDLHAENEALKAKAAARAREELMIDPVYEMKAEIRRRDQALQELELLSKQEEANEEAARERAEDVFKTIFQARNQLLIEMRELPQKHMGEPQSPLPSPKSAACTREVE